MNSMSLVLPIILLVILAVFGVIFFVITKKQEQGASVLENNSNSKNSNTQKNDLKDKKTNIQKDDVFNFMEFDKISDNMVIQNKGTKFTMIIQCKGINYDLMSEVEQLSVEEGFITFLNTLRSPIQLYVQAQNLDLKGTIKEYKNNIAHVREEFENINEEYNRVNEAFDSTKEEIKRVERERNKVLNVYEYASDIVNYVERISLNKSLLQRSFYVLVSYHSSEISSLDRFSKEEIVNICYNELVTRAQSIINGLATCSVSGRILNSNEIADVLYTAYNRDDKGLLSVKEALESGFYRLYSTTEDIFLKKQKKLQEEIDNEAKIKALEALKTSIKEGNYISPRIEQLDVEEQISKKASEIVRRENVSIDIKEKANQKLIEEYRKTKKDILDKAANEYEQLTNSLGIQINKNEEKKVENESKVVDKSELENSNRNGFSHSGFDKNENKEFNIKDSDINNISLNETESSDSKIETKENEEYKLNDNISINENSEKQIDNSVDNINNTNIDINTDSKPIVEKKKLDKGDFEYSDRITEPFDINLSDEFDDRLGSGDDDSII